MGSLASLGSRETGRHDDPTRRAGGHQAWRDRPGLPALGPAAGEDRGPGCGRRWGCSRSRRWSRSRLRPCGPRTRAGRSRSPARAPGSLLRPRASARCSASGCGTPAPTRGRKLREQVPTDDEITGIRAWMDRLDQALTVGPRTRREAWRSSIAPPACARRSSPPKPAARRSEWKRDVRKLKEKGLTQSLAIGYRLSPRGEAVLDHGGPARDRAPREVGTPLPRSIGAPATRALRGQRLTTVEQVATWAGCRPRGAARRRSGGGGTAGRVRSPSPGGLPTAGSRRSDRVALPV